MRLNPLPELGDLPRRPVARREGEGAALDRDVQVLKVERLFAPLRDMDWTAHVTQCQLAESHRSGTLTSKEPPR